MWLFWLNNHCIVHLEVLMCTFVQTNDKKKDNRMNVKVILISALSLISIASVSCGDNSSEPTNATTLNMKKGDNPTTLGNSDVYINSNDNFRSNNYAILDVGAVKSLGSVPELTNFESLNSEVAVVPGNGYIVCSPSAIKRFPSGEYAINVESGYYKMRVEKTLIEKDSQGSDVNSGAQVKFALVYPNKYKLPASGTHVPKYAKYNRWAAVVAPSKDCEVISENSDVEIRKYDANYEPELGKADGCHYIAELKEYNSEGKYRVFIRMKSSYTTVLIDFN